jgi:hypothetical protein
MIFIILLIALIIFVLCYVVKKEYFDDNNTTKITNKYTIHEISKAVDILLDNLHEPHYLVKVNYAKRTGVFIEYEILAYNQKRAKVTSIYAKVKIPFNKSGTFTLVDSAVTDSNEIIKNGTHTIKDSQTYGKVM